MTWCPRPELQIRIIGRREARRQSRGLELQIRAWPQRGGYAFRSRCRKQCFRGSVEVFPRRLGQVRLCANEVANHLPRRQVQGAFWSRSHGKRNGTLWTKTNSPCRRFLARTNSGCLGEQKHGDRFPARLEFPIATKAILIVQLLSLRLACLSRACSDE